MLYIYYILSRSQCCLVNCAPRACMSEFTKAALSPQLFQDLEWWSDQAIIEAWTQALKTAPYVNVKPSFFMYLCNNTVCNVMLRGKI